MNEAIPIINPWVIVHQPGGLGSPIETILGEPPNANHKQYGLLIADLIRHVAKAYDIDEANVFEWVQKEMDNPTSPITRIGPN